jgi:rhodanese-related sulfurtransferase
MMDERRDLVIVDVREPAEWDEGHIDGAVHLPMGEALVRPDLVPAGRPKAVLCAGGLRSSLVISALSRAGFSDFYNVIGGMTAWQKGGYSTVKR